MHALIHKQLSHSSDKRLPLSKTEALNSFVFDMLSWLSGCLWLQHFSHCISLGSWNGWNTRKSLRLLKSELLKSGCERYCAISQQPPAFLSLPLPLRSTPTATASSSTEDYARIPRGSPCQSVINTEKTEVATPKYPCYLTLPSPCVPVLWEQFPGLSLQGFTCHELDTGFGLNF